MIIVKREYIYQEKRMKCLGKHSKPLTEEHTKPKQRLSFQIFMVCMTNVTRVNFLHFCENVENI